MYSNNISINPFLPKINLARMFFNAEILGKSYALTGYDYWYVNIRPIAHAWKTFVETSKDESHF